MKHLQLLEAGFIPGDLDAFKKDGRRIRLFFGGGGGSQPATTTQVQQQTVSPEAAPYYSTLLGQASALTDINQNPYQEYSGSQQAGFAPMQQQAFGQLEGMQLPAQTTDASNIAYNTAGQAGTYQNYQPGQFQNNAFNQPGIAQSYMSPYIETALAPTIRQMQEQADVRQRGLSGQAQQAGAYGGYRHGLQLATEQQNTQRAMGDVIAQGMQGAYGAAQQAYQTDAARRLQVQQAREQSRQYGTGLGLQGLQTQLGSAALLGQMGQQQYGQQLGLNQAQQLAGAQQQQQAQGALDINYQNYLSQQNWPYRNIGFMSEIIGRPLTNTTQQMYAAPPSATQNLLGLGLGAYGLSGMLGAGKKAGGIIRGYARGGTVLSSMPDDALRKLAFRKPPTIESLAAQKELQDRAAQRTAMPMSPQATLPPESTGVGQLPAGNMNFRDGGIVGYEEGGEIVPETGPYLNWAHRFRNIGGYRRAISPETGQPYRPVDRALPSRGIASDPNLGWTTSPTGEPVRYSDVVAGLPALQEPPQPEVEPERETRQDRESRIQQREGQSKYQRMLEAQLKRAPQVREPLTIDQAYGDRQQMMERERANNPLYAERDKYAARLAEREAQNPYVAALAGAQAIISDPTRYGSGVQGLIGPLAKGAVGAGAATTERLDKQDVLKKDLIGLDAALRSGDEKAATHIQDLITKDADRRAILEANIYHTGVAGLAGPAAAEITAGSRVEAARQIGVEREQARFGTLIATVRRDIGAQAQKKVKDEMGVDPLGAITPGRVAEYNRKLAEELDKRWKGMLPTLRAQAKRLQMDPREVPESFFSGESAPATVRRDPALLGIAAGLQD